jgi:hypothetical protein
MSAPDDEFDFDPAQPDGDDLPDEPEMPEGDEPDAPEGDADADEPSGQPEPIANDLEPQQRQSRAQARIRAQQEELRSSRAATEAANASTNAIRIELEQLRNGDAQRRNAAMLETLEPEERQRVLMDQRMQDMQRQLNASQWQIQESADRTSFQARAASDPVVKRYADRVEAQLANMRRNGNTAPRENVLKYLIGEDVLAKSSKAGTQQRAAGKGRATAAAGEPPRSRSNATAGGDNESLGALEARLARAQF